MMTQAELAAWSSAAVAACRVNLEDAFHRVGSYQVNKIKGSAVSREKVRAALSALVSQPAPMVAAVEPALRLWAALAGEADPSAAAQAEAERLIAEFTEESVRQVETLLAAPWPGHEAARAPLERILDRWRDRGPRIAERLASTLTAKEN